MYKIRELSLALIGFISTVHAMEPLKDPIGVQISELKTFIVDQDVLKKIFDKAEIAPQKAEIASQLGLNTPFEDISYKTFANGVMIWKYLENQGFLGKYIYTASFGKTFYVFDEDVCIARTSEDYEVISFADKSILDKLGELDESIHAETPPYDKVFFYFGKIPSQDREKTEFTFRLDEDDLFQLEYRVKHCEKFPRQYQKNLNIFNQLLARNPNLYFFLSGEGFIGAKKIGGMILSEIPATLGSLLSPGNIDSMQSIYVKLRTSYGGVCPPTTNYKPKGAMLENLLSAMEEKFPHLQSLSGIAPSLNITPGGGVGTLVHSINKSNTESFFVLPRHVEHVTGSQINVRRTAEGFEYSIVDGKGKNIKPNTPLVLKMINFRAFFVAKIYQFTAEENKKFIETNDETLICRRGTKADILKTMAGANSEDLKFQCIAQYINLENALRRYEDEKITQEALEKIFLDIRSHWFITPQFGQSPEEAFEEWKLWTPSSFAYKCPITR